MAKKKTKFEWVAGEDDEEVDDAVESDAPPSRSELKRRAAATEQLVLDLLARSPREWARLPLSEEVLAELDTARKIPQRGRMAIRRQIRFIAGLLRHEDTEAIRAAM